MGNWACRRLCNQTRRKPPRVHAAGHGPGGRRRNSAHLASSNNRSSYAEMKETPETMGGSERGGGRITTREDRSCVEPLGPAFTVHLKLRTQHSHSATGTYTSNLLPRLCGPRGGNSSTLRLPVLPIVPRPTMHFRDGVTEYVSLQTAQKALISQRVPATQNKKPPCNNTWWTEIKRTVQNPPLCLHKLEAKTAP